MQSGGELWKGPLQGRAPEAQASVALLGKSPALRKAAAVPFLRYQ